MGSAWSDEDPGACRTHADHNRTRIGGAWRTRRGGTAPRLSAEPENWSQHEAGSQPALQLKQERGSSRRSAGTAPPRADGAADGGRPPGIQRGSALEESGQELEELAQQLREDRAGLEVKERELRLRDAQNHLREAEIREMIEIAELDAARERSELNQERLKLARLREAIRLAREAVRAEQQKRGIPPSILGVDS